jgi:hypothetical protein
MMLDIDHSDDTASYLNFSEDNNDSESGSELQTVAKPDIKPTEPDLKPGEQDSKPVPSRQVVDALKLSSLMSIHARFFSEYSKGRKNCTQLIPNKIWPSVIGINT